MLTAKRRSGWRGPVLGEELVEPGGGVRAKAAEDVGQIGGRVLAVGHARCDQGIEVGEVLAGLFVANEEKVLPAEGNDPQGRFASIVVGWDPRVLDDIEQAGDRVISYQVCDWLVPLPHPVWGRGIPGDGVIDFAPITRAVAETGYDGAIEVEIFNEKVWATDPDDVLAIVKRRFSTIF